MYMFALILKTQRIQCVYVYKEENQKSLKFYAQNELFKIVAIIKSTFSVEENE